MGTINGSNVTRGKKKGMNFSHHEELLRIHSVHGRGHTEKSRKGIYNLSREH